MEKESSHEISTSQLTSEDMLQDGSEDLVKLRGVRSSVMGLFEKGMIKQVIIVGAGFMVDAYDLFVINNVLNIMKEVYPQTIEDRSLVASTALWGAVAGQLLFGSVADYMGRRLLFIMTLILISTGALGSSMCKDSPSFTIYHQLAIWRFLLGLGIGGEYPLAASIAAESSPPRVRGKAIAAVFSMQGIGQLLAAGLVNVCLWAELSFDLTWRVALGFGALPGILMLYYRWKMQESEDFKAARRNRVSHFRNLASAFQVWWKAIVGTAGSWFLLDVTFYGNGLFNTTIMRLMGLGDSVQDSALNSLYVTLMAIPGYYFSIVFLDSLGRWNIQMGGFFMLASLFAILAAGFSPLQQYPLLFIFLYGLTYFFSNFGPNTTTYLIPGEYFPAQVKATCHGLSAASGKLGAALAGYAFPPVVEVVGLEAVLYICAGAGLLGMACTLVVPRYTAEQLEDIKAAQLKEFDTLVHNGLEASASESLESSLLA